MMKKTMLLFILALLTLPVSAQNGENVFFRVEAPAELGNLLTREISHCLFLLPESKRPERFSIGEPSKDSPDQPSVLRIGGDAPGDSFAAVGIVFAVHPKNPVDKITKIQAESLRKGELGAWVDGLEKKAITLCLYDPNSLPGEDMEETRTKTQQARVYFSDPELLAEYVKNTPDAIAILPLSYYRGNGLKILPVEGVAPGMDSVLNGKYPYAEILKISVDEKNPVAKAIRAHLLSREFAVKILEAGAIPLGNIRVTGQRPHADEPAPSGTK